MAMNFLQVPFTRLWDKRSSGQIGTLRAAQSRLNLKTVKPEVKDNYSADKEFFTAFVDAHIAELVCTHFKMETVDDVPTKNAPTDEPSYAWAKAEFNKLIRRNIGTFTHRQHG